MGDKGKLHRARAGGWEIGETITISRDPPDFDSEVTPVAVGKCGCGDDVNWVKAGTAFPDTEPEVCIMERDGAYDWCCTLRKGRIRIDEAYWRPERRRIT